MVIKVKEITIGRGRKWAWDFGNSVGFNVSVTIEGTTAKDTVVDMIKRAIVEIGAMEIGEQERCRNVYDIAELKEGMEYKEAVDTSVAVNGSLEEGDEHGAERNRVLTSIPTESQTAEPAVRKPEPQFKKETIVVSKTGKYEWFPDAGGGKVRKCEISPCTCYLKYNEDIGKYQHGKYDPNTKVWSYTHDVCDYWEGGGS